MFHTFNARDTSFSGKFIIYSIYGLFFNLLLLNTNFFTTTFYKYKLFYNNFYKTSENKPNENKTLVLKHSKRPPLNDAPHWLTNTAPPTKPTRKYAKQAYPQQKHTQNIHKTRNTKHHHSKRTKTTNNKHNKHEKHKQNTNAHPANTPQKHAQTNIKQTTERSSGGLSNEPLTKRRTQHFTPSARPSVTRMTPRGRRRDVFPQRALIGTNRDTNFGRNSQSSATEVAPAGSHGCKISSFMFSVVHQVWALPRAVSRGRPVENYSRSYRSTTSCRIVFHAARRRASVQSPGRLKILYPCS
jgi:hypothetical protein